ncbi:tyrosinase [Streptomyces sp. SID13666]|uniref:apotyrosinase chaperone MelC1 n=1 Tax=unclassified Streptomyces TaxID=2593676 RepID=UPI0013BFEF3C|nr:MULTISPECIES: tyrosinase cofactor [unclassified Streptomyces]NEA56189.1 tyrosinase [Streptomyces sp. SID13666]NEA71860.1 tyrosinase [Streptomyces sp. SID13588]
MSELTRRSVLRGAVTGVAAAAFTGVALGLPVALAARGTGNDIDNTAGSVPHTGPEAFDETYRGRRIHGAPQAAGGHHHGGPGYAVFVDGKELHVMQNADSSWISVVNHYETFATPRAAARAAVLELQGAALVPVAV